ncbi:DNA-directed RNA polymerase subunit alpha [Patescibacteria group bacterium]
MNSLPLPTKNDIKVLEKNKAEIIIEPCAPGFGTTLGNSLRRVLLSSLPGAAATSVKIKNVTHEFSTVKHVKEDVVELILNLKTVRFKLHNTPKSKVILKVKGEKKAMAKDITCPSDVEVTSPDIHIATLTDKNAELEIEINVEEGRGYVPVEAAEKKNHELGVIAIDSIFSPVQNANFGVENVRVGQMTNFDKLTMTIATDGTIAPEEALQQASQVLVDHFTFIAESLKKENQKTKNVTKILKQSNEQADEKKEKSETEEKTPKKAIKSKKE